jgi:iterative type I PKS product template protein
MVIGGALPLQDALLLVVRRAQLMATMCQIGDSTMLACCTSGSSIRHIIVQMDLSELAVACDNSETGSVVSGPVDQVDHLARVLKEKGIRCKKLDVPLGFHSPALDAILPELKTKCEGLPFSSPRIPLGSCFHGRLIEEGDLNADYPVQQTRGLVRFAELIDSLFKEDQMREATFIEVGPSPITLPMVRSRFSGEDALLLPSIEKGKDPWVSISHALQHMSLRHDSINWRGVFNGTGARIVDLPDYPFQMRSLYVPFKEPAIDETVSPSSQAPRPSFFHLLQDVVLPGKGESTFSTSLDVLSEYIQGHSVNGFPLCPASVYHEMVLEAMHYEAAPAQNQLAVVYNITFGHPLVYSLEKKSSTVLLTAEGSFGARAETSEGRFSFTLPATPGDDSKTVLCSGRTTWMSYPDAKAHLARKAAYAKRQMRLLHRNRSETNTLHRNVIYNTIFPRVVTYSEPYQSITEMHVSEADLDGYGTFEIPASNLNGGIVSPVFIDTLLHAAGFVANSQAKPTDAFICSKVESTVVLYTDINPQDAFRVYCSLLECSDGELIGEAFAMTLDGTAVASIEGMVFKRLNMKSFTSHLSRQAGQRSTGNIPRPVVPNTKRATRAVRPSLPRVLDPMDTVVSLISRLCEQPRENVTPEKRLGDLGIDSLMQIELSHSLKGHFPHLDTNGMMESETVQDIQRYIVNTCAGPPGVSFADEESSHSSSEQSDDSSSATTSGGLTPYTDADTTPTDITDLLVQLVANTCGFVHSDVRQDMALESLGMDSLMAIEFQEGVQTEFGKTLTQEMLSPSLTIGELAVMLAEDINSPSREKCADLLEEATIKTHPPELVVRDFIVHLQQGPDNSPPLILVHDGSGLIEKYRRLHKLGCNVFGIRNPQLTAQPHWATDLQDMASRYAALISSVVKAKQVVLGGMSDFTQLHTRYHILTCLGWSFGGVLAHEIAQHLDTMGYTTVAIILIDSPCPLNHQPLPSQVVDYILSHKRLPSPAMETMSSQFQIHARFLAEYNIEHPIPPARKYVILHSEQVLETTRLCGVPYPWLESQQYRGLAIRQWEAVLARSLVKYNIPGNHFEPFDDEYVSGSRCQVV